MPDRVPSFGEPWRCAEVPSVLGDDVERVLDADFNRLQATWEHEDGTYTCHLEEDTRSERIVACVNALAGRDPSKLAELEAAVDLALKYGGGPVFDALRQTIATFRGESDA